MEVEEQAVKSIGNILREARLAKGLTIEDAEAATNIRGAYLSNIENEEYDKTPGEFFVKGAIRTYGNFLGLDGAMLVDQYKASTAGKTLHEVESKGIREAKKVTMKLQLKDKRDIGSGRGGISLPKPSDIKIPWLQVGMGVAALAVIGALYFAVPAIINWSKENKTAVSPASQQTTTAPSPIANAVVAPPVIDKITLEIKSGGPCWLEVVGDDKKVAELMLQSGDVKTYEAKDKLVVKYGNIDVITITVNGEPVNLSGEHGVAIKTYTRESIKQQMETNREQKNAQVKAPAMSATKPAVVPVAPAPIQKKVDEPVVEQPKVEAPKVEATAPQSKVEEAKPAGPQPETSKTKKKKK